MKVSKVLLAGSILASSLFAGNYTIDNSHSSVAFKVKHMMISNVKGTFDKFSGNFEYDEKTKTLKSLNGTIKVDSINTNHAKRDGHLRAGDIFNAKKYPDIKFELTKLDGDTAYGKLTMKGVTKDVKLDYENGGVAKGHSGPIAAFSLSGKIKRSEYGINYNSVLEAGGVAISDTVKLEIDIEGEQTK
jgi:polyisoprenoid-binding protein YceI